MLVGCQRNNNAHQHTPIHHTSTNKGTPTQPLSPSKHVMIVFVHGTVFPLPTRSSVSDFFTHLFNHKKNPFEAYVDRARIGLIYQYQPIGDYGLASITPKTDAVVGARWAAQATMAAFGCLDEYVDASLSLYTFGWNGQLTQATRLKRGEQLYEELSREIASVLAQKNIPRRDLEVIVFAHSHGGNVALNMATGANANCNPLVDRLILLGTPVQKETEALVESPLFKEVLNVYSKGDSIQTLDFISTKGSSRRKFKHATTNKLTQINVTIGQTLPSHVELYFFNGYKNILEFMHNKK